MCMYIIIYIYNIYVCVCTRISYDLAIWLNDVKCQDRGFHRAWLHAMDSTKGCPTLMEPQKNDVILKKNTYIEYDFEKNTYIEYIEATKTLAYVQWISVYPYDFSEML